MSPAAISSSGTSWSGGQGDGSLLGSDFILRDLFSVPGVLVLSPAHSAPSPAAISSSSMDALSATYCCHLLLAAAAPPSSPSPTPSPRLAPTSSAPTPTRSPRASSSSPSSPPPTVSPPPPPPSPSPSHPASSALSPPTETKIPKLSDGGGKFVERRGRRLAIGEYFYAVLLFSMLIFLPFVGLQTRTHILVSSLVISWSITEIIRYSFFGTKELFGSAPSWLLWLRYSSFLVMYPTGIGSKVGLIYVALPFIKWQTSEKYVPGVDECVDPVSDPQQHLEQNQQEEVEPKGLYFCEMCCGWESS